MKHLLWLTTLILSALTDRGADAKTLRVFNFAGHSNMVGIHSKVTDIQRFPPFAGVDKPQANVLFSYKLGREDLETSHG